MSGTKTVTEIAAGGGNKGKKATFKNCSSFTDCRSEINNTQVDNTKENANGILMPVCNFNRI